MVSSLGEVPKMSMRRAISPLSRSLSSMLRILTCGHPRDDGLFGKLQKAGLGFGLPISAASFMTWA